MNEPVIRGTTDAGAEGITALRPEDFGLSNSEPSLRRQDIVCPKILATEVGGVFSGIAAMLVIGCLGATWGGGCRCCLNKWVF